MPGCYTTILKRYKPSLNQPITLFKGEDDYEYFWDLFYNLKTGSDAETQLLVVFMNEESGTSFEAWLTDAVCVCSDLNGTDGILTFTINFNGTVEFGTVAVTDDTPAFTAS